MVMYGYETCTIKKAECQRMDAFKLWGWRRLLKVPWTARRSNSSILRKINPEYSLEWLMLKLKLWYFGHLMQTDNSLEKSLTLGKIESRRRRGHQRMRWLDGITMQWTWAWVNFRRWWGTERPGVLQSIGSQRVKHDWTTATTTTYTKSMINTGLEMILEICTVKARVAGIPGRSNVWFILIASFHVCLY